MALPVAVTAGSLAIVLAAGVGYALSASAAGPSASPRHTVQTPVHRQPTHHVVTKAPSKPTKPTQPVVPHTLVVVFNNTPIKGLAAQKANLLSNAGWHVAATDNWYGSIPESTVYYPPGLVGQAHQLATVLHISRIHPAVAPMQLDRLTVILASG